MFKQLAYGLVMLGGIGVLSACAIEKRSLGSALQTNDIVFSGAPEALPDKINVYTAMARAAKYSSDASAQNMFKKIYDGNSENPLQIAQNILHVGQDSDKLYNAAKALDFANIYAMSVLTDNQKYIENAFYVKSAQNLSVAAIKLHREAIFAEKEIKQIDRLSASQEKILRGLDAKMERSGDLTEPELNYKKGLEVALNNLAEIKKQLQAVKVEYMQLIKTADKDLQLEGKRFYELDDFDKRYNPDIFQDSAVTNRREFALAKERLGSFNAAKARRQAYVDYPPVARLDINGLEIEDSRYEKELFNKAERATMNLLNAVVAYQENQSKENLHQKAFDELAAVVMTQVEVAYRLVERASYEYEANLYKKAEIKKIIKALEKKKNLPDYEKVDLLNKRVELIACEQKEASVLAERGASLRSLYYLAGLSPFDKNILKGRIKDIEQVLKQAFGKDVVNMLSAVKEENRWDDGGNSWAHKDKWLDKLIDGNEVEEAPQKVRQPEPQAQSKRPAVIINDVKPAASGSYSMMQLGAYSNMDNAISDQKDIKASVAVLKGYDFFIETAVVNGVQYHRLMVKPEPEKLQSLCQQVKNAGFDCILK